MTNKEIRKEIRNAMVKKGDRSLYNQARLAKAVLLFDPEYGDLDYSMTRCGYIDYDSFLTALQQMANVLKVSIWQAAKIVKVARDLAVDEDNYQFHMPATREVIEALK